MSTLSALGGGLVATLVVACSLIGGHGLTRRLDPSGDSWDRAMGTLVVVLSTWTICGTALGAIAQLSPLTMHLLVLAMAVTAIVLTRHRATEEGSITRTPPSRELLVALGGMAVLMAYSLAVGLAGRSTGYDTNQYHVPNIAQWLQTSSIWPLTVTVPGYPTANYPSGLEVSSLVWLAPDGSDRLLYVALIPWFLLAVVACAVLARALGGRVGAGAIAGLAVMACPLVVVTHIGTLGTDVSVAAGITAALAYLARIGTTDRRPGVAILAGASLGLAVASKYTAFVPALAVVVAGVAMVPRDRRRLVFTSFMSGCAALGGFWLMRNLWTTGNPLFPLGAGPLRGAESPLTALDTSLAEHVIHGNAGVLRRWAELAVEFYGALVILPVVMVVFAIRRKSRPASAAFGVAVITGAGYLVTPYTGGGPGGADLLLASQLRYVLPAVLIAAAAGAMLAPRLTSTMAAAVGVHTIVRLVRGYPPRPDLEFDGVTVIWLAVGILATVLLSWTMSTGRLRVQAATALAALTGLIVSVGTLAGQGDDRLAIVEQILSAQGNPDGSVAVVFAGDVRSLMGEDLDIKLVAPTVGGDADERPTLRSDVLDERLDELDPTIVAIERTAPPTVPAGWTPDDTWVHTGAVGTIDLFVRTR